MNKEGNAKIGIARYNKHLWYRNLTGDGGAQAFAIKNMKENEVVITSWKGDFKKWTSCSPEILKTMIKKDLQIFEILLENQKKKIYFDVDGKKDTLPEIKELLKKVFPNCELQISGSITKIQKKDLTTETKYSFHIVLSNYYLNNLTEFKLLKNWISKHCSDLYIDDKVYTNNRMMKAINQSKGDKRIQKYIEGSEDIAKHLITCFFDENCKHALEYIPKFEESDFDEQIVKTNKNNKKIKKSQKTKSNIKLEVNNLKQLNLKEPDIDIHTCSPLELINIIPNNKTGTENFLCHTITWSVALYCNTNNVCFEDFWKWARKKSSIKSRRQKYIKIWDQMNKMDISIKQVKRKHIILILEKFYPRINVNNIVKEFKKMHDVIPTKIIDRQFLKSSDYDKDVKYTIISSGMGSNKTGSIIEFIHNNGINVITGNKKEYENNFIFITPRKTLAANVAKKIRESNIKVLHYLETSKNLTDKINELSSSKNIIIQNESLHYLSIGKKFNIIVVDEMESVINTWISSTHGNNLKQNWKIFQNLLKNAKKIFFLDAFITMRTIDFINILQEHYKLSDEIEIIDRNKEYNPKKNIIIVEKEDNTCKQNYILWKNAIINKIKNNNKVFIFYPYKSQNKSYPSIEQFGEIIAAESNIEKNDICIYHGDADDEKLKGLANVEDTWSKLKAVICNSCITVGVDYSIKNSYSNVFIAWVPFLTTRSIVQSMARIRNPIDDNIYLVKLSKRISKVDFNKTIINSIYDNLCHGIELEERAKNYFESFEILVNIADFNILYNCGNHDKKLDIDIKDEINNFDHNLILNNCPFKFDNIDNINGLQFSNLVKKISNYDATFGEKLKNKKYLFVNMFNHDTDEKVLRYLWDNKKMFFFDKMIEYKKTENHWIDTVLKECNISSILSIKSKFNLSSETRDLIKNKFNLYNNITFVKPNIHCNTLFAKAINTYFNGKYMVLQDNSNWVLTPLFINLYTFGVINLKIFNNKYTYDPLDLSIFNGMSNDKIANDNFVNDILKFDENIAYNNSITKSSDIALHNIMKNSNNYDKNVYISKILLMNEIIKYYNGNHSDKIIIINNIKFFAITNHYDNMIYTVPCDSFNMLVENLSSEYKKNKLKLNNFTQIYKIKKNICH